MDAHKEILKDFIRHLEAKITKRETHYRRNRNRQGWLQRSGNSYKKRTDKLIAARDNCQEAIKAIEEYIDTSS